jgi:steroid delta-isomerase-like uncharacterized protein
MPFPLARARRFEMSVEDQSHLVTQWIEAWNSQDLTAARNLLTPDYQRHDANLPDVEGPDGSADFITSVVSGFPDIRLHIEQLIAQDQLVAARLTVRGTHRGPFLGVPPTGREVTVDVMDVFRLTGDKIAEEWVVMDTMGLLQQLGAIPGS